MSKHFKVMKKANLFYKYIVLNIYIEMLLNMRLGPTL